MDEAAASQLPLAHLESLKFKANQIIESIHMLRWMIEGGNMPFMPAWPDILTKYNVLLSQTHTFSNSLVNPLPSASFSLPAAISGNVYRNIALHPGAHINDAQMDNEVAPLLRNQQTIDVINAENNTVRRLCERLITRGSAGVHAGAGAPEFGRKPEYSDVLQECAEIRSAHDQRAERAARAVAMLKDKFEWKQRVEVEVEEPEELDWVPQASALDNMRQDEEESEGESEDEGMDADIADGEGGWAATTPLSSSGTPTPITAEPMDMT